MPRDTKTLYRLVGLFAIFIFKFSVAHCSVNLLENVKDAELFSENSSVSRSVGEFSTSLSSEPIFDHFETSILRKRKRQPSTCFDENLSNFFVEEAKKVNYSKKNCGAVDEFEFFVDYSNSYEAAEEAEIIDPNMEIAETDLSEELEQFPPHFKNGNEREYRAYQLNSLSLTYSDSGSDLENDWTSRSVTPITGFTGKRLLGNANFFQVLQESSDQEAEDFFPSPEFNLNRESVTCNIDEDEYGSDILDGFMFCDLNERGKVTALHSLTNSKESESKITDGF